jgi:aryl-alcohol dehydrogenase-like predicted oxidoreductase
VLVRGSVAQGLLINKAPKAYLDYPADDVAKMARSVREFCRPNRTATQVAIKYVLQHRAVCSAVVGMRTIEQVQEAVKSLSVADLSENELDKLKTVLEPNKYKEHR